MALKLGASGITFPDSTVQTTATLVGASGSAGSNGATGSAGSNGTNGATGSAGATGIQGPTGGASGPQGASGVGGGVTAGATGFNGVLYVGASGGTGPGTSGGLYVSGPGYFSGQGNFGVIIGTTGPMTSAGDLAVQKYLIVGSTGLSGASGSLVTAGSIQAGSYLNVNSSTFGATGSINSAIAVHATVGSSGVFSNTISIGATGSTGPYTSGSLHVSGPGYFSGSGGWGVTIGTTGPMTGAGQLSVQNAVFVGANAMFGATGSIRAVGDITSFYTSDKTLKENIQDIPSALDKIVAIGGKTFDWTDEYIASNGGVDGYFLNKADYGVIAQDVQEVFPIAIRTRDDGKLAVDYDKLVALAFAAIKELKAQLDAK